MDTTHRDMTGPQQQLLSAAVEVFAEKGYRGATIAEICHRAGANVAAVNYYFHSKEALYAEAWKSAFEQSMLAHPPGGDAPPGTPPEQRLETLILSLMRRIGDPNSREFDIVQKELASPTGLLHEVMRGSIDPIRRRLEAIIRELLGGTADEKQVQLCQMSIRAQCFDLMHRRRRRKMFLDRGLTPPPGLDIAIEETAAHVARFSLAGLAEIRRRLAGQQAADQTKEKES